MMIRSVSLLHRGGRTVCGVGGWVPCSTQQSYCSHGSCRPCRVRTSSSARRPMYRHAHGQAYRHAHVHMRLDMHMTCVLTCVYTCVSTYMAICGLNSYTGLCCDCAVPAPCLLHMADRTVTEQGYTPLSPYSLDVDE